MRSVRALVLATIAALAVSDAASAQWQVTADAGVSHLRQTGIPESVAQTIGAAVDGLGERTWFHGVALSSLQANTAWTGQAMALGGISGRIANPVRWELGGALSGFAQTNAASTTSSEASGRIRFGGALGGVALGGGGGVRASTNDNATIGRGALDAWWSARDERLFAGAATTHVGRVSYTDVAVGWRHEANGASIGASAALRSGAGNGGWQAADAELWMSPRVAVVLAIGSALPDAVRGTPGTRYASASLRVAWQPHATLWAGRRALPGVRVSIARTRADMARIDIAAPQAGRVELMADFTNWEPVSLERAGDGWFVERAVTTGLHRIAIRLDGGPWLAPANVPSFRDEGLGGALGLITVP